MLWIRLPSPPLRGSAFSLSRRPIIIDFIGEHPGLPSSAGRHSEKTPAPAPGSLRKLRSQGLGGAGTQHREQPVL